MRRSLARPIVIAAAGASLAAAAALSAPGAAAAASHPAQRIAVYGAHGFTERTTNSIGTSNFVAGYVEQVTPAGPYTATATFNVPTLDCSSSPTSDLIPVLFVNGTLANDTQSESGLDIFQSCSGTTPQSVLQLASDGAGSPMVAIPTGTQITFAASVTPTSESYHVTIGSRTVNFGGAGLTNPFLQTTFQGGFGSGDFPPFATSAFRNITVDGQPFAASDPNGFNQVDGEGNVMIQTSPFSTNGKAFALTYVTNVYMP
jgi:hypothetical protein